MCNPRKRWESPDVPPDASSVAVAGRNRRAGGVAIPHNGTGVRPHSAAAVLLLQPGRCRQPDRQMVLVRRDLEAPDDHAVGIHPRLRDRLAWRRPRWLLV